MAELNYVEMKVKCIECERELKIVALEGTDHSDYLCPSCSSGEFSIDVEEQ
jgi:Zn finger protein HypA/HybF involved in hydrogenase expression